MALSIGDEGSKLPISRAKLARKKMLGGVMPHRFEFRVRWGDCDPAGIVFYPRFLEYMNDAMHGLVEAAGFPISRLATQFGAVGFPMVGLNVDFRSPMRLGEPGVVESRVVSAGRSSLLIEHRILSGGELKVEARETRVFTARRDDGSLGSVALPPDLKEALLATI